MLEATEVLRNKCSSLGFGLAFMGLSGLSSRVYRACSLGFRERLRLRVREGLWFSVEG